MTFHIAPARPQDVPVVLDLVRQLADYERLSHQVVASEAQLHDELFGPAPVAECVLGWEEEAGEAARAVGFALYFHNFSTFLARRGLYLEDLFVLPAARGRGYGRALIAHVARIARERGCGRFEWAVLEWNRPAIGFYRALGASCCRTGASAASRARRCAVWVRPAGSPRATGAAPQPLD